MTDMQRPGRIGGNKLDLDFFTRADIDLSQTPGLGREFA